MFTEVYWYRNHGFLCFHGSQPAGYATVESANEMRKGVWGGGG